MGHACCCHGAATTPTQVLKSEHRVIEKVLDAVERRMHHGPIDKAFFEKSVDFFRNFADGCHHAKEENELFPVLESAGIPREGGPIGCMLDEHEQGRFLLRQVSDNLDAASRGERAAADAVRRAASGYVALLRRHIFKEDNVLFALADNALGPEEQRLMMRAFDRAEESNGNVGKHERYLHLADELAQCSLASV